jgi:2-C-methyl-D-erythritol 4-phosphate cytidylyltransferase / 2-C-methyl-D-erythritol 2,4-cyclodiphosphate synthase
LTAPSAGPAEADVVIVAAGSSSRMGDVDKLTAPIGGRPLLAWSVAPFAHSAAVGRIVVVAAPERVAEMARAPWLPDGASVVPGGSRRQESVAAGVAEIERLGATADRVVLVHDGARPAVRGDLIEAVARAAGEHGAAIPALPVIETLKRVTDGVVAGTIPREEVAAAQTPQGIQLGILQAAYARFPPSSAAVFTDEAALLEACTIPVHVVPGHPDNLKVTLPADLDRARWLLAPARPRVGFGTDSHPFGPGAPLALGGVEFAAAPRLAGHSDGDVVLHAVADALLGAAGLNDLGRLFPADARTPVGVASADLLDTVVRLLSEAGLAPSQVDVTIVGARPRLGDRLDEIRERLASLLSVPIDRVNVKASTGNLDGAQGAGRGIAATAVALLEDRR